jgi:methionyl-tRNA formyltransferase
LEHSLKIIFFGTPGFAAQVLEFLIDHRVAIKGVVTQPDRPKGRSLRLTESPVKGATLNKLPGVPIWQPQKCSNPEFLSEIAGIHADLFVVVAFGQILPQKLLDIPPLGCINVHASLLPKYRGAAPIQRAILDGEKETGIAIQKMVKELDAGDVIDSKKISIPEEMTYGELEQALCDLSKPLLLDVINRYAVGIPEAKPQDPAFVTYAPKIEPEEGEIRVTQAARSIHCLIRAFNPRPGAWVWIYANGERKRLKIWRSKVSALTGAAGQILSTKELIIGCGENSLHILEVQPEGKPRMSAADWLRGMKGPIRFNMDNE